MHNLIAFSIIFGIIFGTCLACSELRVPEVINNDRVEQDGRVSGFVEIESPGLKLSEVNINILFEEQRGRVVIELFPNKDHSKFSSNLKSKDVKVKISKTKESIYKLSINTPKAHDIYLNFIYENECGMISTGYGLINETYPKFPFKVTKYLKKLTIVEKTGADVELKVSGDILDRGKLNTLDVLSDTSFMYWHFDISYKNGIPDHRNDPFGRDRMIINTTKIYNPKKLPRSMSSTMKIENFSEKDQGLYCFTGSLRSRNYGITSYYSTCTTMLLRRSLGTGIKRMFVLNCDSADHPTELAKTGITKVPIRRGGTGCLMVLVTGHPAPYVLIKEGRKYYDDKPRQFGMASLITIPEIPDSDFSDVFTVYAGYHSIDRTARFKAVYYDHVRVKEETKDDGETIHMTCKVTGDPAPTAQIYGTNGYYANVFPIGKKFNSNRTMPILEMFPSAIVDIKENGSKMTLTLEKHKIADKIDTGSGIYEIGIGCVGQNKYSHNFKFQYFNENGNQNDLYNSTISIDYK